MANFLTDGRTALLAELKGDAAIDALVKTWREFGPGLRTRFIIEPAYCILLALYPASGSEDQRYNMAEDVRQDLLIRVLTAGQDAAPGEELVALVIARVGAVRQTALGLSADGLRDIRITDIRWDPIPNEDGALVVWDVSIQVRLDWIRTI